ncbi:site-specific integrase [Cryobacterium algoricola]|uniref:Site-specific integrase n=1 Tax=Cryobacterium algoricola TaxID=1259183 RepID=A0ABY2ICF2_9MICO|nr:site-specific integrase [Cryobacterium algoricola]
MVRPRTPISNYGTLSVKEVSPGRWRARTRYRFDDGTLRQIERFATTRARARIALQTALDTATASRSLEVNRQTSLAHLADRFLATKEDCAPRTIDTYRQTIAHHIKPKIGALTVSEATTERLGRFISEITSSCGPGAAKACRAVLSGMMGVAARSDAVVVNPVREIGNITRRRQGATAIPVQDLPDLLEAVRRDARLNELDQADVIVFLAGTGCRLGEALALRWSAFDPAAGTISIEANVVRAHGRGLLLQDHPKTKAGARTISIPNSLRHLLMERQGRIRVRSEYDLVFPTVRGNIRDPRNTSRDWRDARDRLGYPTVTTHSFRKTVATALDHSGLSAREIADYLGHENPSLTQDVYMAKSTGGTKAAKALDVMIVPKSKVRG